MSRLVRELMLGASSFSASLTLLFALCAGVAEAADPCNGSIPSVATLSPCAAPIGATFAISLHTANFAVAGVLFVSVSSPMSESVTIGVLNGFPAFAQSSASKVTVPVLPALCVRGALWSVSLVGYDAATGQAGAVRGPIGTFTAQCSTAGASPKPTLPTPKPTVTPALEPYCGPAPIERTSARLLTCSVSAGQSAVIVQTGNLDHPIRRVRLIDNKSGSATFFDLKVAGAHQYSFVTSQYLLCRAETNDFSVTVSSQYNFEMNTAYAGYLVVHCKAP
jgi:hypothetical protein